MTVQPGRTYGLRYISREGSALWRDLDVDRFEFTGPPPGGGNLRAGPNWRGGGTVQSAERTMRHFVGQTYDDWRSEVLAYARSSESRKLSTDWWVATTSGYRNTGYNVDESPELPYIGTRVSAGSVWFFTAFVSRETYIETVSAPRNSLGQAGMTAMLDSVVEDFQRRPLVVRVAEGDDRSVLRPERVHYPHSEGSLNDKGAFVGVDGVTGTVTRPWAAQGYYNAEHLYLATSPGRVDSDLYQQADFVRPEGFLNPFATPEVGTGRVLRLRYREPQYLADFKSSSSVYVPQSYLRPGAFLESAEIEVDARIPAADVLEVAGGMVGFIEPGDSVQYDPFEWLVVRADGVGSGRFTIRLRRVTQPS